ncbi:MAG: hypothetical protein ABIP08_04380 [Lautropia sp.]
MIVAELRRDFPLAGLLKVSGLARSTFYYHFKKAGEIDERDVDLRRMVRKTYELHKGRYGYRRITAVIRAYASMPSRLKIREPVAGVMKATLSACDPIPFGMSRD